METTEAPHHLYEHPPDVFLFEESTVLLMVAYLLKEVTRVCVLHHDTMSELYFDIFLP